MDDFNFVDTPYEISIAASYLKKEFKMKDLVRAKYCLGIQVEHFPAGIFIHQLA